MKKYKSSILLLLLYIGTLIVFVITEQLKLKGYSLGNNILNGNYILSFILNGGIMILWGIKLYYTQQVSCLLTVKAVIFWIPAVLFAFNVLVLWLLPYWIRVLLLPCTDKLSMLGFLIIGTGILKLKK